MAIASRQLSRLRHRTQELKAQEQDLKAQEQELKMQELALQRETETLKAQEQKLKRQEQMLENLLFTIESRKPTTPKKEPFTLNSLLLSLKSQNTIKDITNESQSVTVRGLGRYPVGPPITITDIANNYLIEVTSMKYNSQFESLLSKYVFVERTSRYEHPLGGRFFQNASPQETSSACEGDAASTGPAADAFKERVFELSEFDENAIVSKRAQVVEEVNSDHQHQVELDLHHG